MGILKSILVWITYLLTGGIFLVFIIPVSLLFLPFGKHKKVFSHFLFGYMKWIVRCALPFLQVLKIVEFTGAEKIGKSGIIISNHQSFLDGFLVMGHFPSVPLIKASYKYNPLFLWVAGFFDFVALDFFPAGFFDADKKLRKHLKNNDLLYILPEGTRSSDGNIQKFQSLAFKIANDTQSPIFPVILKYSEPIMSKSRESFIFTRKVNVKIHVLDEIRPAENENTAKFIQRVYSTVVSHFDEIHF